MLRVELENAVQYTVIEQFMREQGEGTLTMHYEEGMVYAFSDENDALFFKLTYL